MLTISLIALSIPDAYRQIIRSSYNDVTSIPRIISYDEVIKWKNFPRYWPFVWGIHRSPVNSPNKGQWRRALMFSLILRLNKRLSKQSRGWWFETPLRPLWRHSSFIDNWCTDQHLGDMVNCYIPWYSDCVVYPMYLQRRCHAHSWAEPTTCVYDCRKHDHTQVNVFIDWVICWWTTRWIIIWLPLWRGDCAKSHKTLF